MTMLTIPVSCPLRIGTDAITRETRNAEITSFKVRNGFVEVQYERKCQCPPATS